jgi:hypothetical protein
MIGAASQLNACLAKPPRVFAAVAAPLWFCPFPATPLTNGLRPSPIWLITRASSNLAAMVRASESYPRSSAFEAPTLLYL